MRQIPGCQFVQENENRCAENTMRGRPNKTRVAKVARASKKICGPTRRDDCKNHDEPKIGDQRRNDHDHSHLPQEVRVKDCRNHVSVAAEIMLLGLFCCCLEKVTFSTAAVL